jgi:hypothetical protein
MLQVDDVPAFLVGTKNYFTDSALFQQISNTDENETIWSSDVELDTQSGQVVAGHNIFAGVALGEWLDAEIALDSHRAHSQKRNLLRL